MSDINRLNGKNIKILLNDKEIYFGKITATEIVLENGNFEGYISLEQLSGYSSTENFGQTSIPLSIIDCFELMTI